MNASRSLRPAYRARWSMAAFAACAIVAAIAAPAAAQEHFAGQWRVASAVAAPWARDFKRPAEGAEIKRFLGKTIAIGPTVLRAPEPLGCARPKYDFRDAGADTLFEGSLNADGAGKSTDPVAAARALGMTQKTARGMTASCSEVEFFLVDPDTILFGLNNRVFTVKRAK
jgi:hypothetical protein